MIIDKTTGLLVLGAGDGGGGGGGGAAVPGVVSVNGKFLALDLAGDGVVAGTEEDFAGVLYATGMAEPNYFADSAKTTALPEHVREGETFESGNRILTGKMPRATYVIEGHTVKFTAGYIPYDTEIIVPCSGTTDPDNPGTDPEEPEPDVPPKDYRYTVYGAGDEVVNGDYYFDRSEGASIYFKNDNGIILWADAFDYWYFAGDLGNGETEIWSQGMPRVQADPTTITTWLSRDGSPPMPTIILYGEEPQQPGSGGAVATAEDLVVTGCGIESFNGVYKIQTPGSTGTSRKWVHTSGNSNIYWSGGFWAWHLCEVPNNNGDENDFVNYSESDVTATWSHYMGQGINPPTVKYGSGSDSSGGTDLIVTGADEPSANGTYSLTEGGNDTSGTWTNNNGFYIYYDSVWYLHNAPKGSAGAPCPPPQAWAYQQTSSDDPTGTYSIGGAGFGNPPTVSRG